MRRSVLLKRVTYHQLIHYVTHDRVDGTPEGEDVRRVVFGCGLQTTFRRDPYTSLECITCIACLAHWFKYKAYEYVEDRAVKRTTVTLKCLV